METTYGELQIGIAKRYGEEIFVETTVDASERGGAERVLSLEAEAKTTGVDLMEGEAEVTGKVNYRLLYVDREGKLCGLDYFKDFKCRVRGEEITPSGRCAVTFSIPDAEARLKGEEISLAAMTMVEVRYFGEKTERVVTAVGEGETLTHPLCTERAERHDRMIEVEKIVESGQSVKKILLFDTQAVVTRITQREDGKEVAGEVRASVVFLNEAEEPVEIGAVIPFCEIFEEGTAECAASIKNARIVLTDEEGGGSAEIEAAVLLEEITYQSDQAEVVAAVCLEKAQAVESASVAECERFVKQLCFEEPLAGTLPLGEEGGYVALVRPGCHAIASAECAEGGVKVEGVAAFQAICLTDGGSQAQQGELPFSFFLPCEGAEGARVEVAMTITDVKGMGNGKDLSVTAKVNLSLSLFEKESVTYLSDVAEGEPYPENNAGISVYFADPDEDLWSIAKAMKTLPSELLKTNPSLEEQREGRRSVILMRKK